MTKIFFRLALCALFLAVFSPAWAQVDPMSISRLVADVDSRDPMTDFRTPLILVHGLDSTPQYIFDGITGASPQEKASFVNFIDYFYDEDLDRDFVLYRFHYLSNILPVTGLAEALRLWVDELTATGELPDGEVVILAHSMGGLVSREFIARQTLTVGEYAGRPALDRVRRLITLGTPHHGSPSANDQARHADDSDFDQLLEIIDDYFWGDVDPTDPNRSDLRWDNYAALPQDAPGYDDPREYNEWLAGLNQDMTHLAKVVAYVGSTQGDGYPLADLREFLYECSAVYFSGLYAACEVNGYLPAEDDNPILNPFRGPYDDRKDFDTHIQYAFLSVLLARITDMNNDALVPVTSAALSGVSGLGRRYFYGYDHEHMKAGMPNDTALFDQIALDLASTDPGDTDPPDDTDPTIGVSYSSKGGCVAGGGMELALVLLPLLAMAVIGLRRGTR